MTATATARATGVEHVHSQVVDQYIALWNETDPHVRRELIARP